MTTKTDEQERVDFDAWWVKEGQYCRAGGGDYEKTFAYRAYQAGRAALQSQDRDLCFWTHDEDIDAYGTTCGNAFIVGEGTPAKNDMKFCCYCGGSLVERIDHARRIEGDGE